MPANTFNTSNRVKFLNFFCKIKQEGENGKKFAFSYLLASIIALLNG